MNMNDTVSVILTDTGAKIMNDREKYYQKNIPNYIKRTYSCGDKLQTQLWCLFDYFGEYIYMTCDTPFKDNEISTVRKVV